ncbi:protein phosphatase inhibitor 2-like [Polyodon spathula]|uniref:protein phosphatase inhibitor 2-like n=1 Tax=Polyodon spathula TaxID=7913 RepID=UPI001B7DF9FA|nr:protein phosphatase inhibitor 2-like [Polyodon spathula]
MDSNLKPKKCILKKRSSSNAQKPSGQVIRGKSQRWDEMNILTTHHPTGKDYGFMKIDELQTPYCSGNDGGLEEAASSTSGSQGRFSPKLLAKRLMALVGSPRILQEQTEEDIEEEGGALSHDPAEQQSFELQRRKHYDEGQHVTREVSEEEGRGGAGRDEGEDDE